jgi:hypothetical protein
MHAMGGYTRLASQHAAGGMYLSNVNSGFMMLFGAGLDVKVSERWGVRADRSSRSAWRPSRRRASYRSGDY